LEKDSEFSLYRPFPYDQNRIGVPSGEAAGRQTLRQRPRRRSIPGPRVAMGGREQAFSWRDSGRRSAPGFFVETKPPLARRSHQPD
jgi:hypothetical protein